MRNFAPLLSPRPESHKQTHYDRQLAHTRSHLVDSCGYSPRLDMAVLAYQRMRETTRLPYLTRKLRMAAETTTVVPPRRVHSVTGDELEERVRGFCAFRLALGEPNGLDFDCRCCWSRTNTSVRSRARLCVCIL